MFEGQLLTLALMKYESEMRAAEQEREERGREFDSKMDEIMSALPPEMYRDYLNRRDADRRHREQLAAINRISDKLDRQRPVEIKNTHYHW